MFLKVELRVEDDAKVFHFVAARNCVSVNCDFFEVNVFTLVISSKYHEFRLFAVQ